MTHPVASIAICTRNRAAALEKTLDALGRIDVPRDVPAEVIVVDNGSTDATRELVATWRRPTLPPRYVLEVRQGLSHARNTALAAAQGTVILFLDDDVRPPTGWLEPMCHPILSGAADAVAGGVRIADHLRRPWMETVHLSWLASTEFIDSRAPQEMVGANMALGRRVLAKVPAFDPELGQGALGQGEDSLFSWQLLKAGFTIAPALEVVVEHHFDVSRLLRSSFRHAAKRRGRSVAYQKYHWEHAEVPDPKRQWRQKWLRFVWRRLRQRPYRGPREGMPAWEMAAREELAFLREWQIVSKRSRNYDRFGLVKRVGYSAPG